MKVTDITPLCRKQVDCLVVEIHPDRQAAGRASGKATAAALREVLQQKGAARMIFAAAPSQNECLETLVTEQGIDWRQVTAFHMDEYLGLSENAPQKFAHYLNEHLFRHLPFAAVHFLQGPTPEQACLSYSQLLSESPIDIVCLGVGENGHIAFNDPPVADFRDPNLVKIVDLELACRQQQVNDGCFPKVDAVPEQAITLTIPAILSADCLICTVPGTRKRTAVHRMLEGDVTTDCPASILRGHPNCTMFVDLDCWGTLS